MKSICRIVEFQPEFRKQQYSDAKKWDEEKKEWVKWDGSW